MPLLLHAASPSLPSLAGRSAVGSGPCAVSLIVVLLYFCLVGAAAIAAEMAVQLRPVELRSFSQPTAPWKDDSIPAFREEAFPLQQAVNLEAVLQRVGGLDEAQKRYLERHRFLVLPRDRMSLDGPMFGDNDEMLSNFDAIGGIDAYERDPAKSPFIGPDAFLHALHCFFSLRLRHLEQAELSHAVFVLLEGLQENLSALRKAADEKSDGDWERLQAQLLVPLILIKNTSLPGGILMFPESGGDLSLNQYLYDPDVLAGALGQDENEPVPGRSDSLDKALALFADEYSALFSPETAASVTKELNDIYRSEDRGPSAVGMRSSYDDNGLIDYTQFTPRGHYETNPISRAYFRAMIYLGQIGWNLETEQGLTDAVNLALAMSYVGPDTGKGAETETATDAWEPGNSPVDWRPREMTVLEAWKLVMEITEFFAGYPDAASYPEWQAFLRRHAGKETLNVNAASDMSMRQRLTANLEHLRPSVNYFKGLQEPWKTRVLCVFPQRFTVPWLIADRLTYKAGQSAGPADGLPVVFSGLWVPGVMGSRYARSLVPLQILFGSPAASLDIEPGPYALVPGKPLWGTVARRARAVLGGMKILDRALRNETPSSWFSSLGAVWMRLLGTVTEDFGPGYPLYMRDQAFSAKQLETFMGSFTELKHDTLLYEKPNYSEMGEGGDDDLHLPVPKGFVEPNMGFWNSLLEMTAYVEAGFRRYGLFPRDVEEYGSLGLFRKQVELCATLAAKELAGQALTDEKYDGLRPMSTT
ncbi:MAG: DUF3160 domain-containing protein [Deltaproteobacteria bacterium]|jgi:hypothetical protein|nr:DUF3160 domain-containing protein [Deltaproteobacteria bacterium]